MFICDFAKENKSLRDKVVDNLTMHTTPSQIIGGTGLALGINHAQDKFFNSKMWKSQKPGKLRNAKATAFVAGTVIGGMAISDILNKLNKRLKKKSNFPINK